MCGLAGMAGDFVYNDKAIFKDLLVMASLRGSHSTGAAGVNIKTNDVKTVKCVGNPYDLFEQHKFSDINPFNQHLLIGHGRHATRGSVNKWNAHPFETDNLVGAHNGTLNNDWELRKAFDVDNYGTDSETLFAAIDKVGVQEAIGVCRGAWALTWYDRRTGLLHVLRNKERSLWYAFTEEGRHMFWASEQWMLAGVVQRYGLKLKKTEEGQAYFSFPEDTLMTFEVATKGRDPIRLVNEEIVKGDETKQQVVHPFRNSTRGYWEKGVWVDLDPSPPLVLTPPPSVPPAESGTTLSSSQKSRKKLGLNSSASSQPPASTTSNTLQPEPNGESTGLFVVLGKNGKELSEQELLHNTRHGCQWCSDTIASNADAFENIGVWLTEDTFLCSQCSDPDNPNGASAYIQHLAKA